MNVRALRLLAAVLVSMSTAVAAAQQPDLDRGLDEARALYGEAKFPEAVAVRSASAVAVFDHREKTAHRHRISNCGFKKCGP